jgi:hypothetical protein
MDELFTRRINLANEIRWTRELINNPYAGKKAREEGVVELKYLQQENTILRGQIVDEYKKLFPHSTLSDEMTVLAAVMKISPEHYRKRLSIYRPHIGTTSHSSTYKSGLHAPKTE